LRFYRVKGLGFKVFWFRGAEAEKQERNRVRKKSTAKPSLTKAEISRPSHTKLFNIKGGNPKPKKKTFTVA